MVRVTKPGGMVASYTWDILRGGSPTQPLWEEMDAMASRQPARRVRTYRVSKR